MSRTIGWFLVLALVVGGWLKWQVVSLGGRLDEARQENGRIAAALTDTRTAIDTLQAAAGRLAQEEETLREDLNTAHRLALTREQKIQRLLNENQQLRDWFNAALPADVARLHQRPGFTGAADYLRWLSEGERVPDTGQPPGD
ncbi:Rz-like lysis system protein LysB [Serratia entomophila]|uniref:Rz-like lysis system protein LysB n=1 Tax=Serratia entomophila TaxID=42906 RepID=UPI00217AF2F2|nr:Rz-like lysis system protein LysB [Serratia entomophila]CAI1077308.1 phage lysis regulatory protein, LysB family [Serratia entomophila]CAI1742175.1 phage lysis regulatory protein, LysB family [Serratia entomophila]CAI1762544.1 phage lysis regulatory protein, LysB family [Serratia entomophila]CAI1809090.1 phage lysis regulatory protein, LysB family [Serratia entomophila]CAI1854018.1 phage lysis regulatory protein, LysB family [Serratia entomophila]